jgi:hypothetical protein
MSYSRRVGCRGVEVLVGKMLVLVQPAVDVVCIGERNWGDEQRLTMWSGGERRLLG